MKKIENCNYAVELGLKLKYNLEGATGQKISEGNKASVSGANCTSFKLATILNIFMTLMYCT